MSPARKARGFKYDNKQAGIVHLRLCGLYICVRCRKHKTELPPNPAASLLRLSVPPNPSSLSKPLFDVILSSPINTQHAYCSTRLLHVHVKFFVRREILLGFKLLGLEIRLGTFGLPTHHHPAHAGHLIDTHTRSDDRSFLYALILIQGCQEKLNSSHG